MKTFHLNVKNKRDFDKIVSGKILAYPIENKVHDFLAGKKFSILKIWHGPERKKDCITRRWAGTTICDGTGGQKFGVVVNMVRCENCIDWAKCSSSNSSRIVTRKEKAVSCVRMSQFSPILNQT